MCKVKIYCNIAQRGTDIKDQGMETDDVVTKFTKKQVSYNNKHRKFRARIENTFGRIKFLFSCLAKPWAEEKAARLSSVD